MADLQNKKYGFRYFGLLAIVLLHNLDACTSVNPYYDKALKQGDPHHSPEVTVEQHDPTGTSPAATSAITPPPIHFPNSSSSVRILTSPRLISMLNTSNLSSMPTVFATTPSANISHVISLLPGENTTVPGAEADDMTHGKKYDGQYDVDDVKGIAKKYNQTKEMKNVTKPPSVVDTNKKDSKIDTNKNGTKPPTPEVNIKNATTEKAETKQLSESKNTTSAVGKTEEVHKGVATLIVPTSPPQPDTVRQEKSTSTLREIGKTLAAILVTIVGTASVMYVGFVMWRRISRRYYGHREMLINEDDFEEVSDLHHFEGTTDIPPSQTIISQR